MSSPFTLPDGNVQIAFSGGRTSGMMLHHILEANGGLPDRAKVIFTNTGREMPETLDFVQECGERWGVPIVWAEYRARLTGNTLKHDYTTVSHETASRNGEPLIDLMRYMGFTPNRAARFCSHEGKTRTARRYCVGIGWERWTTAIGIRADECGRALKTQPKERYRVWYPMLDAGMTKRDVASFWNRQPFGLQLPHTLGNCDGCFLKSEAARAMLARDFPCRAAWWADQEQRFGTTFHASTSWREMISVTERQSDWIFDTEGALCQADDGECVG